MDSIADYEAWKARNQQNSAGSAQIVLDSVETPPDQSAEHLNLADEYAKATGNPSPPLPLVREYRSLFQQRIDAAKNSTILSRSPRLSEWLRNPVNASVAKDDIEGLSWWEKVGQQAAEVLKGPPAGLVKSAGILMEGAGAVIHPQDIEQQNKIIDQISLAASLSPDALVELRKQIAGFSGIEPSRAQSVLSDVLDRSMTPQDAVKALTPSLAKTGSAALRKAGIATQEFGNKVIPAAPGFEDSFGRQVGEGLGSVLAIMISTAALGPVGGGVVAGGLGAGEAAANARQAGKDEDTQAIAALYGIAPGLTDLIPIERLLANHAVKAGVGHFLKSVGIQAGMEGSQEALQQVMQNLISKNLYDPNKGLMDNVAENFATGGATGGLVDALRIGVLSFLSKRAGKMQATAGKIPETQQRIADISAQAQASKLRERMPEKFRQFVEAATANGPVENVYVPAEQFAKYFQSQGIDPHSVVDGLDGVTTDDLDTALVSGGDLKIPTAAYATKFAGSEHDAFLMENMRLDPDEFTSVEVREFNARAEEAMQEAFNVAEELRQHEEQSRSFEQEIYDTMVSHLRAAGRSTDVATSEAMLYPAFYRVMAERSGMTTEEFLKAYPLPKVKGSIPEGMQLKDVGAFDRTLAEARSRRTVRDKRQSLLEFISDFGGIDDAGGELRSRDAEVVKRGKSKKTLKLARSGFVAGVKDMFGGGTGKKHGADAVVHAAVEAGFMADDPAVQKFLNDEREGRPASDITPALWAAIDRELRGEPQYSANEEVDPKIANAEALDQIENYLGSLGVSLDDDDAAIKNAIQQDQDHSQTSKDESALDATQIRTAASEPGLPAVASKTGFSHKGRESKIETRAGKVKPKTDLLFQGKDSDARGMIQFLGSGDTVIRLFENADLSTFLHESGHYFLTVMQDLAGKGEAQASGDYEMIKNWWRSNAEAVANDASRSGKKVTANDVIAAIDKGTTGNVAKDNAINVGMQEQWARGLEQYLMEGKAPSAELRSAFEKFRAWMLSVYKKLRGLNVNVSDDLRKVFDRMLASDEEIASAQDEAGGATSVFTSAEAMGLTPEQYDAFLELRDQAQDDAKAKLLRETMDPIKRQREKWFKDERAKVREETEREINAYRYYRAFEWMANRRWLSEDQPIDLPDIRLSKDILVDRYGEGILKTLPRGKQAIYTKENGLDPDDAAGWFGFGSGDEMVRALEKMPKRNEAIEAETDKIMRERHGDVLNDGEIEAHALDAVHNDKRGQWIAAELKAIAEVADVDIKMTAKDARASARLAINRMRVRDAMNANRFLAAERKAANEAAKFGAQLAREKVWLDAAQRKIANTAKSALRGKGSPEAVAPAIEKFNAKASETTATDYVNKKGEQRTATKLSYNDLVSSLIDAKRRQLLNHSFYMEARKVADEVENAENYVATLNTKTTRERIAGAGRRENAQIDYLAAIDELMERYDFRRMSGKAEDRRGALQAFVQAMTAAGRENELGVPETVLISAARKPYKTLPVEELRGVIDSLKNLEHVATRWDKLIDAQQQRTLDQVVSDIVNAFYANLQKRPPSRVRSSSEGLRSSGRQFLDLVLNATTLLREIDGFKDGGATYQNIKGPIDAAMNRLISRKEKAARDLESLYSVYSKAERRKMSVREHMPELGFELSKWEQIAVALNTGNAGNFQRLTDPNTRGSLSVFQVNAVLARLDERDAKFVQSVWDYVGSFKADIGARERRVTGVEPEWVEPTPIEIGGKTLTGGYYPIKYDPRLSTLARDDVQHDIAQSIQAGRFGKAQTRNGHLKDRVESSGRDVELDIGVLHRHVNQVIYDLELSEPVANSWRILQHSRVRDAFIRSGKQTDFDALEIWLKDVAEGELRSADFVGRAARTLKSNFTAAKLALNLASAAIQVTGVAQSMVVVGKKDFAIGVKNSFRRGISDEIAAKSSFMASRQTTFNKDIYDFYTDPKTGPVASRWSDFKSDILGPLSFWLMTKVQWYSTDVPTWLAGYNQGLRKFGNDEAKAIAHADDIVKRAQASGLFSDRSAIERGSVNAKARQNDVVRLFTALGSFMFARFNVAYERSAKAGRTIKEEGVSARSAQEALSWTLDMGLLFIVDAVVTAAIKGQLPGGDDDDDGWAKWLAEQTAFQVMGVLPFIRDAASAVQGFNGGGAYGSVIGDAAKGGKSLLNLFTADEVKRSDVKNIINATGIVTGLPATQANRVLDAAWRASEGEDVSPLEYIFGKRKHSTLH